VYIIVPEIPEVELVTTPVEPTVIKGLRLDHEPPAVVSIKVVVIDTHTAVGP